MILVCKPVVEPPRCYPCTSGDDPATHIFFFPITQLSLHKRGWSWNERSKSIKVGVIPAQAGMILVYWFNYVQTCSYPCTSGDDPEMKGVKVSKWGLSLHKRGWSSTKTVSLLLHRVIPAQAGMIPAHIRCLQVLSSYPCTSGDDPTLSSRVKLILRLSLHKRGWSYRGATRTG